MVNIVRYFTVDGEKVEPGLIFLEIAKRDLEATKFLFNRKLYPHSVFYLQQAIEKATKSLGIWNKTITVDEAKNTIKHGAWRIYLKIINEMKNKVVKFEKRLEEFPRLKEVDLIKEIEISKLKNTFDEYQMFPNENETLKISFSRKELQSILTEIDELRGELNEGIVIKIDEKETENIREKLYQLLDVFSEINPIAVEETKKGLGKVITPQAIINILKKLNKPISKLVFCYISLFYLSLIFSPHAVRSRYPQDDFNPLEVYNKKMPLIQMLDSFIKIVGEILEKLNHVYAEMPSALKNFIPKRAFSAT